MAGVFEVEVDGVEHADHGLGNHEETVQVCVIDGPSLTRKIKEIDTLFHEATAVDS